MYAILKKKAKLGETIYGDGTLEILPRRIRLSALARDELYGKHR